MMAAQFTKIVQIVPRLPPYTDGVGDYALQLAGELLERDRILSEFLVFRPGPKNPNRIQEFPIHRLNQRDRDSILALIPEDIAAVVLQYSNYPYLLGKLDTPSGLVHALETLKTRQNAPKIVVMFHELPTLRYRKIRCPNPIQRRVSRHLARIADAIVTNNTAFQQTLSRWSSAQIQCIPNFSTIGEPEKTVPLLSARDRTLIVFGSSDRSRIYRHNSKTLSQICQKLGIKKLYDIGRPLDLNFSSLDADVETIETGFLPAAEVSKLLLSAIAGIFDYNRFPNNLSKSTVYAAYSAHGLLPISNRHHLPPQDGIIANRHYLATPAIPDLGNQTDRTLSLLQIIADSARSQYRTHSLAKCAGVFARCIQAGSAIARKTDQNANVTTRVGQ